MQEHLVARLGIILDMSVPYRMFRLPELSQFEGPRRCVLTPGVYVSRMLKYGQASPCCFVVAMIYLERLKERLPSACLTSFNMQRLLLTLVMLASKYLDDYYCSNRQWAMIGDLPTRELNKLELDVLLLLNFKLNVSRASYNHTISLLDTVDHSTTMLHLPGAGGAPAPSMITRQTQNNGGMSAQQTASSIKAAVEAAQAASRGQARVESQDSTRTTDDSEAVLPKGPSPRRDDVLPAQQQTQVQNWVQQQQRQQTQLTTIQRVKQESQHTLPAAAVARVHVRALQQMNPIEISSPVKMPEKFVRAALRNHAAIRTPGEAQGAHKLNLTHLRQSQGTPATTLRGTPDDYFDIPAARAESPQTPGNLQEYFDIPLSSMAPGATAGTMRETATPRRVGGGETETAFRPETARAQYLSSFFHREERGNAMQLRQRANPDYLLPRHEASTPRKEYPLDAQYSTPRKEYVLRSSTPVRPSTPSRQMSTPARVSTPSRQLVQLQQAQTSWQPTHNAADTYRARYAAAPSTSIVHGHDNYSAAAPIDRSITPSVSLAHPGLRSLTPRY